MIRHIQHAAWLAALFIACQWLAPANLAPLSTARAAVTGVTCMANMTSINFGNVDPSTFNYGGLFSPIYNNYNLQTTGYLTYYCTNTNATAQTITACFSIGNPGGSVPRAMNGPGGSTLGYQIYQNAGGTTTWGSSHNATWGSPYAANVTVPAKGASAPVTVPAYATITSNQGSSAGSYTANYGTNDVALDIVAGTNATCNTSGGGTGSFTFQVLATIAKTCQVTTNPLAFPISGDPSGVTANTTLVVQCSGTHTGYQVGLDNGKNYDGTNRNMLGGPTNSNTVSYGLYQNSADTIPWGNTTGTGRNTVTGTTNPQTFTVYGKVNTGQGGAAPGNYFDAVTVYVYY